MLVAGLALGGLWAAGCTSVQQPAPQQVTPTLVRPPPPDAQITFQPVTPPPPQAEKIPEKPSDDYVWIPGRWVWRSIRNQHAPEGSGVYSYIWDPGRWAIPPHPGAKWVPDKWTPGYTTPDVPAHWE
jgi:hypothetical protein